jgi:hypothetical protein
MKTHRWIAAILLALVSTALLAQASPPMRVRGMIEKFDGAVLSVKSRDGTSLILRLDDKAGVSGVVNASLADIVPGKFIGTATLGERDGALVALEVLVFPDAMRGAGEGHYAWDLQPQSMMTNATIVDVTGSAKDRTLTLKYKDGERKVLVPEGTPIVTFVPADRSAIKPGAHCFIGAAQRQPDGSLVALRIAVGLNGVVPPM